MIQPLFKYIGNKYRSAGRIVETFPRRSGTYYEPFLGSGAVLGALRPAKSVVSDTCEPLIALWRLARTDPQALVDSYTANWEEYVEDRKLAYEQARERFNTDRNPHDFLFVSRACYGGVIRFRRDGYLSTPLGAHTIIHPEKFAARLKVWNSIIQNTEFVFGDFSEIVSMAGEDDIVYCDPPYIDTQRIIYGAQDFDIFSLYESLAEAKERGAFIALSIDGVKKTGAGNVSVTPPADLFEVEAFLTLGGSMLKRFWRGGGDVFDSHVKDRLLLSHDLGAAADLSSTPAELQATG